MKLMYKGAEDLKGSWDTEELHEMGKNRFFSEKVIRKRTTNEGEQEVLVKWKGWAPNFHTGIPSSDLQRVT